MGSSAAIKFGTCNLWRAPHRKTSRMDVPERFATGDIDAFGLLFRQFLPVVLRSGTAGRGEVIQPRKLIDQRDRIGSNSEFFRDPHSVGKGPNVRFVDPRFDSIDRSEPRSGEIAWRVRVGCALGNAHRVSHF